MTISKAIAYIFGENRFQQTFPFPTRKGHSLIFYHAYILAYHILYYLYYTYILAFSGQQIHVSMRPEEKNHHDVRIIALSSFKVIRENNYTTI